MSHEVQPNQLELRSRYTTFGVLIELDASAHLSMTGAEKFIVCELLDVVFRHKLGYLPAYPIQCMLLLLARFEDLFDFSHAPQERNEEKTS